MRFKKLKSLFLLPVFFIFAASLLSARVYADGVPEIISETAILIDAETGQVLYQKNPDKKMYPASTTKIMTALLVAEKSSMNEMAMVFKSAIDIDEWDSANISLVENEEMSVDSLMYAMMMPSANDAANVLAEHISGGQNEFADMMTERANAIGAVNTRFANPHGLHDPDHYTTARDLALITQEAVKNKTFMKYFGASEQTIPATNLNPYERPFINYQYMLVPSNGYYYPDVAGGKVGYTHEAGHTMSTFAERNGRKLICVVMKSPNRGDKFADTKKLLDFGFSEFAPLYIERERFPGFDSKIMLGENEAGEVSFRSTRDFKGLIHNSLDPSALKIAYSPAGAFKSIDEIAGYAEIYVVSNDPAIPNLLSRIRLEQDVTIYAPESPATVFSELAAMLNELPWLFPLFIFFAVLFVFLVFLAIGKISSQRKQKRRLKRLEEQLSAEQSPYNGPIPVVGKHFLIR